jgi:D-serine dehydratase
MKDIQEADARLRRFAPYLAKVFPETAANGGVIESDLKSIPRMKEALSAWYQTELSGELYLKLDSHLPISGSVKARGGVYEVLSVAEKIAIEQQMLTPEDDYSVLAEERFRKLFSKYRIAVGSTGNLGLSIGVMGAKLGFEVIVHMSAEAKQWKKDLLRTKGATVIEHSGDYAEAVAAGRRETESDPMGRFIDDENSTTLFLGYSTAALRLKCQLNDLGIAINSERPLIVYLPCGVGGAPGGITFGLKTIYGDQAHCFFSEPTQTPAMLLGLMTGRHNLVSAGDFGLDTGTEADGLAVGRPSGFVGQTLEKDISGVLTVSDDHLFRLLKILADTEDLYLEPSALAGFPGPFKLMSSKMGQDFLQSRGLNGKSVKLVHLIWATGGGMVPKEIMDSFYRKGTQPAH